MRSSRVVSAILAPIFMAALLAGCGTASTIAAGSGGTQCGSGHRAEVVVEFENKKVDESCVSFKGSEIAGEAAMTRGNIEFAAKHLSLGDAICQIAHQPKSYTSCFGSGQPYWALYIWSGKGPWRSAQVGVSEIELRPGDALGWHYGSGTPGAPPKPPKV
jgi:hypothetical protein